MSQKIQSFLDSKILKGRTDRIWVKYANPLISTGLVELSACFVLRAWNLIACMKMLRWTLWCSPDCGLKTREWKQVLPSIDNMVQAAANMRTAKA